MASYPSSIVTLATHNDGDSIPASDVNTPNAEIVAMETGLLNGFQHDIKPLTDNANDLGNSTHAWRNAYIKGTTTLAGLTYTWPASQSAGSALTTDGSGNLSWASGGLDYVQLQVFG